MITLDEVTERILAQRRALPPTMAMLVGITGIDGSGKGYLTAQIAQHLRDHRQQVAVINLDGWLNLPDQRFCAFNPAEHFYHHAFRFDALWTQLVLPLRQHRSIALESDFAEETATEFRKHGYDFSDIDIILLDGIYLLKRAFQGYCDVSIWVECSFETALERAIARSQEGLSPDETIRAYRTIYFPAQQIHVQRDQPQQAATCNIINDWRLAE